MSISGPIEPSRTALLVMDYQNGFLGMVESSDELHPDLHEQLQARGIDTLILAGISTSGCVHSTVLDAYDRDYRVIVLSDAVADRDAEVHDFLLKQVFPKRGEVLHQGRSGQ